MNITQKSFFPGLCLLLLALCLPLKGWAAEQALPAVTFATISKQSASQPLQFLGRIEAIHFVDVHTRTEGFIKSVNFQEGQMVKEGDLLFELDPAVHQAAVDQAKAQVASAQAALDLAVIMYNRTIPLARTNAVSQTDADRARADRDMAQARLAETQALLSARELELSFTRITAPLAGRIGHTRFDTGSYVNMNSGPLVGVAQLDPIRVVIAVRESDFISATLQDPKLHLDLFGKDFSPQIRLANGKVYPQRGTLDSVNNQIDPLTGTVEVRARFANPRFVLLPGGVADVTLDAENPPLVPVVPATALQQEQNGHFVLLLTAENTVEVRPVKLGRQMGQDFIVDEGLAAGDRVIVEGLQRVRPGMAVRPIPLTTVTQ